VSGTIAENYAMTTIADTCALGLLACKGFCPDQGSTWHKHFQKNVGAA